MKNIIFLIVACFFYVTIIFSQNTCPIILIHGFLGWGRDEMAGYYYWGGRTDLESYLNNSGYDVHTVSVGPVSPNFYRAIETFYQIKGGQLDYGNEKTRELGIITRPSKKKYNGLYPLWDSNHPVHIIAHSQGGQTARMLEMLLKSANPNESSPLLSEEYYGWIKSITTISTPHNGTTLVPIMTKKLPFIHDLAPFFGGIDIEDINNLYSFDLEHWGLERRPDESLKYYYKRIGNSPLSQKKNLCTWDLSLEGTKEFNNMYITDPDVYYFSFSTYATKPKNNKYGHRPDSKMSLPLKATSLMMGKYKKTPTNGWFENDGICNSISMTHPSGSSATYYNGIPQKGIWQITGRLHMDHQAVIGHFTSKKEFEDMLVLYSKHAELLLSLR